MSGDSDTSFTSEENQSNNESEENESTDESNENEEDSKVPSIEEQKVIIMKLEKEQPPLKEGDTWYIIDAMWYRHWRDYVKYEWSYYGSSHPGPITNGKLLEDENNPDIMRRYLYERHNYIIISKEQWEYLYAWYGGGPVISRNVINVYPNPMVEIRKLEITFVRGDQTKIGKNHFPLNFDGPLTQIYTDAKDYFSKVDTVSTMRSRICEIWKLEQGNVRLWDYCDNYQSKLLETLDKTLYEYRINSDQKILVEQRLSNGEWPEKQSRSSSFQGSYGYYGGGGGMYSNYGSNVIRGKEPTDPGKCGLSNLGNTCFMNSSLQCLSNCVPLTSFFLTKKYKGDLNPENPLGTKGKLVEQYFKLLKCMWNGDYKYYSPRDFKNKLEKFAPQFVGMQQHDSQELLAFLLDGIHEDLNRVKKKPYIELKEAEGRPDTVVADEAWKNHLERNNSVIVDLFHGQLKSTLICPDCDRVSITFDPFMYLPLPLPAKKTLKLNFVYVPDAPEIPTKYQIVIAKAATIADFKVKVSELVGQDPSNLVVTDISADRCHISRILEDKLLMDNIDEDRVPYVHFVDITPSDEVNEETNEVEEEEEEEKEEEEEEEEDEDSRRYGGYGYGNYNPRYSQPKPKKEKRPRGNPNEKVHLSVLFKREVKTIYHQYQLKFGLPFIVTIKSGISYDELYQVIFEKIKRYISTKPVYSSYSSFNTDNNKFPNELFVIKITDKSGAQEARKIYKDQPTYYQNMETLALIFPQEYYDRYFDGPQFQINKHSSLKMKDEDDEEDKPITLNDCVELFSAEEKLGPDDPWYCNKCKDHKQATKKFDLWKLPPILVVQLKRFSYKNRFMMREKLETLVNFPLEGLDLTSKQLSKSDAVYDLFAVSNHYGELGVGHYTAYAKNINDDSWYSFDDSSVTPANKTKICSEAAYLLFYRRRDHAASVPLPVKPLKYVKGGIVPTQQVEEVEEPVEEEDEMDENSWPQLPEGAEMTASGRIIMAPTGFKSYNEDVEDNPEEEEYENPSQSDPIEYEESLEDEVYIPTDMGAYSADAEAFEEIVESDSGAPRKAISHTSNMSLPITQVFAEIHALKDDYQTQTIQLKNMMEMKLQTEAELIKMEEKIQHESLAAVRHQSAASNIFSHCQTLELEISFYQERVETEVELITRTKDRLERSSRDTQSLRHELEKLLAEVEEFTMKIETAGLNHSDNKMRMDKVKILKEKERSWLHVLNQDELEIKNLEDRLEACSKSKANDRVIYGTGRTKQQIQQEIAVLDKKGALALQRLHERLNSAKDDREFLQGTVALYEGQKRRNLDSQ